MPRHTGNPEKYSLIRRFLNSVWLFPVVLLLPLIIFTILGISGSSIGYYHKILYGDQQKDSSLIANEPRSIRSDEWLVNTQQVIMQSENGFARVNDNVGNGQDMSLTEAPVKDWSTIFRPQNIAYFLLPLEQAFAFRWWIIGYLLIISCYFFTLAVLPKKRLLASLISLALFFSAFVQWWYLFGTLGSIYYSLFIATAVIHLCRQKRLRNKLIIGGVLVYLAACFGLVLYPPFQISCALVLTAFLSGYAINQYFEKGWKELRNNLLIVIGAVLIGGAILGAFIFSRIDIVNTINNTAYPGQRSFSSGKFYPEHFMSSHLGHQFLSEKNTEQYLIDGRKGGHTNQSEASNFLLLVPFLLLPALVVLYKERGNRRGFNWSLLALSVLFVVFLLQLFAPSFTPLSKLFLLNKVGDARLLIGMGLLNIMFLVVFIRSLAKKEIKLPLVGVVIYCLLVLVVELLLSFSAQNDFGSFITTKRAILLSLPVPIILYLLLTKRFILAAAGYLAFSIFTSATVNPLYRGLDIITSNPLSIAIKDLGDESEKRWVSDGGYLENIASLNGERSLSGVYNYPQSRLWSTIPEVNSKNYNRYAHVGIQVIDGPVVPPNLKLITADGFVVSVSSCSDYLKRLDVELIATRTILKSSCTTLEKTVSLPNATFYIYKVNNK